MSVGVSKWNVVVYRVLYFNIILPFTPRFRKLGQYLQHLSEEINKGR
jgi:hypothetical protein